MRQKNFEQALALKKEGKNHSAISRLLGIRRPTIVSWLAEEIYADNRGWQEGKKRTHTDTEEDRIVALKQKRIDHKNYFLGAPYIQMDYEKTFPSASVPTLWFVNEVMRRHALQTHAPKKRSKGQSIVSRLKYPIRSIVELGRIQQSSDFIGKKYIAGSREPVSIFSTSYYQWLELYQIRRVPAEKAEYAIESLAHIWTSFPLPQVMRMDNGSPFRGAVSRVAEVGRFLTFLLNLNIIPLFSAAYQSYTNPHVEGHNRTFTEKLWSKHHFTDIRQIDRECDRFNGESKEYFEHHFKERLSKQYIRHLTGSSIVDGDVLRSTKGKKICFIRFVDRWKESDDRIGIVVMNCFVQIPEPYLNQYVLASLNLETATLHILSEYDRISKEILQVKFPFTL